MKKKTINAILVISILAIAASIVQHVYNSQQKTTDIAGSCTLGIANTESSWGIFIADELKLFAANGLNVTLRPFETGLAAYNAMLKGDVDVSVPAEFVVVGGALKQNKIRIIATLVKSDFFTIVVRKDQGIEKVSDLSGKRIGLKRNTIEEFFLGRILDVNSMSIKNVTVADMTFSAVVGAIRDGVVDAVVTIPQYSDSIRSTFGAGVVEWSAQNGQWVFGILVSSNSWIDRNPDLAVRLIRAIDQANMYIAQHPKESRLILRKRLNLDAESVEKAWLRNHFALSMDQSLIHAMEDEARFLIRNNLTSEKTVPDFTRYIYSDGLKAIKPEAVNIIR
jgi:NitT/TauT family transport system substrate-binding protein